MMPSLAGRNLVCVDDLSGAELLGLLKLAEEMARAIGFGKAGGRRAPVSPLDRILATLFYEPSTRTRMSFESAMLRLGGQVTGFSSAAASSAAKGECLADAIRIVSAYCDIMVLRHPLEGAARLASRAATVPFINGGDGAHLHPTQALTDLFLLLRKRGRISGLCIGLLGDLRHGRTVHSLAPALARLGATVVCISPDMLRMPKPVLRRVAEAAGGEPPQVDCPDAVIGDLDALYVTRIQQERFESAAAYHDIRGCYVVDPALMAKARSDMLIMHPLPRIDEIHPAVDADPRAVYFEQAAGGVPVRMALIAALLGLQKIPDVRVAERPLQPAEPVTDIEGECLNEQCVIAHEPQTEPEFVRLAGDVVCAYCERPVNGA
jgi:aspartate carbamoyltransferase catalytic subunit